MRSHIFSQAKSGLEISFEQWILSLDVLYELSIELDLGFLLKLDVLEILLRLLS